jgi:hypothetical protein
MGERKGKERTRERNLSICNALPNAPVFAARPLKLEDYENKFLSSIQ